MKGGGFLQVVWISSLMIAINSVKLRNPPVWDEGSRLASMVVSSRMYNDCVACLSTAKYLDCPDCLALYKDSVEMPLETKRGLVDGGNAVNPQRLCDCAVTEDKPTDLGTKYYPRHVHEVKCDSLSCANCVLPYQCEPITFPLFFLVKRQPGDTYDDSELPPPLRSGWKWETVKLTVGCTCTA